MNRKWLWALSFLLVIPALLMSGCGCSGPATLSSVNLNSQQTGIWVSGEGEVTAVPDVANVRLGVEARKPTVEEAQEAAATAMSAVREALQDNGVAERDIQTEYFRIYDVTRWAEDDLEEVTVGYRVTNIVTAKIRQVSRAGDIIDAVVLAGGDVIRVDDVSFDVDDPTPYYRAAREDAMDDARSKAEQLANAAEVTLGSPTYVSESSYVSYYPRMAMDSAPVPAPAAEVPETPISAGEMEIRTSVQVAYSILQ